MAFIKGFKKKTHPYEKEHFYWGAAFTKHFCNIFSLGTSWATGKINFIRYRTLNSCSMVSTRYGLVFPTKGFAPRGLSTSTYPGFKSNSIVHFWSWWAWVHAYIHWWPYRAITSSSPGQKPLASMAPAHSMLTTNWCQLMNLSYMLCNYEN